MRERSHSARALGLVLEACRAHGAETRLLDLRTLALPVFYSLSPSMLVGVLPFLRESTGKWLAGRAATSPAAAVPVEPAAA